MRTTTTELGELSSKGQRRHGNKWILRVKLDGTPVNKQLIDWINKTLVRRLPEIETVQVPAKPTNGHNLELVIVSTVDSGDLAGVLTAFAAAFTSSLMELKNAEPDTLFLLRHGYEKPRPQASQSSYGGLSEATRNAMVAYGD